MMREIVGLRPTLTSMRPPEHATGYPAGPSASFVLGANGLATRCLSGVERGVGSIGKTRTPPRRERRGP